jgi:hypothetical protein
MSYEVKHVKRSGFRVTKKDPCLHLHFHILNLFKSLSNLGFDQDTNGWAQNSKKSEK